MLKKILYTDIGPTFLEDSLPSLERRSHVSYVFQALGLYVHNKSLLSS